MLQNREYQSILLQLIQGNNKKGISELLLEIKDIEFRRSLINDGLVYAAMYNKLSLCKYFTNAGANKNHYEKINGYTAAHAALYNGNTEIFQYLLEQKISLQIKSNNGETPIDLYFRKLFYYVDNKPDNELIKLVLNEIIQQKDKDTFLAKYDFLIMRKKDGKNIFKYIDKKIIQLKAAKKWIKNQKEKEEFNSNIKHLSEMKESLESFIKYIQLFLHNICFKTDDKGKLVIFKYIESANRLENINVLFIVRYMKYLSCSDYIDLLFSKNENNQTMLDLFQKIYKTTVYIIVVEHFINKVLQELDIQGYINLLFRKDEDNKMIAELLKTNHPDIYKAIGKNFAKIISKLGKNSQNIAPKNKEGAPRETEIIKKVCIPDEMIAGISGKQFGSNISKGDYQSLIDDTESVYNDHFVDKIRASVQENHSFRL